MIFDFNKKSPLFNKPCRFLLSVADLKQLPPANLPEIALIGRSNVGKSSLINALVNQKNLARTSSKPGRTRLINYFVIDKSLYLVDLPGYGYAKTIGDDAIHWEDNIYTYFQTRANLRRVFLLVDTRLGLKRSDTNALEILANLGISCQIVYTKTDKVSNKEVKRMLPEDNYILKAYPNIHPIRIFTSLIDKIGINEFRAQILEAIEKNA